MAMDLLMLDANLAAKYKPQRDELYRLLHSDEVYRSAAFIAALSALRDALRDARPETMARLTSTLSRGKERKTTISWRATDLFRLGSPSGVPQ